MSTPEALCGARRFEAFLNSKLLPHSEPLHCSDYTRGRQALTNQRRAVESEHGPFGFGLGLCVFSTAPPADQSGQAAIGISGLKMTFV